MTENTKTPVLPGQGNATRSAAVWTCRAPAVSGARPPFGRPDWGTAKVRRSSALFIRMMREALSPHRGLGCLRRSPRRFAGQAAALALAGARALR